MKKDISIVVPVYNEEDSVTPLVNKILDSLVKLPYTFEIILVDDGSSDNTYLKAKEIALAENRLKVVKLKSNYGQTVALHAGFHQAEGDIIISMDGDLQNDPDDIGQFVKTLDQGYDIVLGWRHQRKDFFFSRKLPSRIANWLISKVTGIRVKDNGCAIRAYRAEALLNFPMYSEMHRLMPVMTALAGARFTEIKVKHHERQFGKSKYGLSRIYRVLFDLVILKTVLTFFHLPLYGFGTIGFLSGLASLVVIFSGILLNEMHSSMIVIMGVSFLLLSLSLFLLFLGFISQLVYNTGNIKIEKLLGRKKNIKRFSTN